ncbi:MAG TPA: RNA 2',3'-cyclic phosphodiesterase [Prolixibacteraceae bacterium]|nr:RNA 2',3'-cyclic phosphodiesterase [Prolixibacteraceae bacterium]
MKRLFIGVPIRSEKVFQTTETWRNNEFLNRNVLKWAKPENWHITLIFLGNTSESEIALIQQLIVESFSRVQAFSTELIGVGVFPNTHKPKVLWLGLESLQFLMPAYTRLGELLQQNGFSLENKPFKPHLTLAMVKNSAHLLSINLIIDEYQNFKFDSVLINRVVLYESISMPDGPVYKPLFVKELEGK